jgi:hypothetical protein
MRSAMKSMRSQQTLVIFVGLAGLVLSGLFAAFIVPVHWYLFSLAYLVFDVGFQSSLLALVYYRQRRKKTSPDKTTTTTQPTIKSSDHMQQQVHAMMVQEMTRLDQQTQEPQTTQHASGQMEDGEIHIVTDTTSKC